MKSIKNLFLMMLWLVVMGAAAYFVYNRGWVKAPTSLTNSTPLGIKALSAKDQLHLENAFTEATAQIGTLSQRGAETANTSSQVLGEFIQVNEADGEKSTSEKALEYGRYLYCQQVVKDWENP